MSQPDLSDWIGRYEEAEDIAAAAPLTGLAAMLDYDTPPWRSEGLPPLAHWLHFLPRALQRDLASDGHPRRGGFLPPVDLPRRMWAGGALTFTAPIRVGEPIRRRSTIAAVAQKVGRSGKLVFVKVVHEIFAQAGLAVREEQDLVYRDSPKPDEGQIATARSAEPEVPDSPLWQRSVRPDRLLLFRFSALTFNSHRIHYDRDYCRDEEGYPGLVVHGPLTAVLLMDLFLRHRAETSVKAFRFRAHHPLFDTEPFTLCGVDRGAGAFLWALDHAGRASMTAELETAP